MKKSNRENYFLEENTLQELHDDYANQKEVYQSLREAPYGRLRENLVLRSLNKIAKKGNSILEIGCGMGNYINRLLDHEFDAYAVEGSENIKESAQEYLRSKGKDPSRIEHGDWLEFTPTRNYDHIVSNGVICYIEDQKRFLAKVYKSLNSGGFLLITHRNHLFNLFAMNKGSLDLIKNDFLGHYSEAEKEEISNALKKATPGLDDSIQKFSNSQVYRSAENPLTIAELYESQGFKVHEITYNTIHPYPPKLTIPISAKKLVEIQDQYEHHWAGMFIGSQFLVVAEKQ